MLEVSDLTKDFGGIRAVNKLSFEVKENELLGIIGPNGSGKTTTINLISGALQPTAGKIIFRG
ncbi:MAG: ATP-binding cassette domain-containing protein, partial [Candidatus Bathyarchaeia archaeon]